MKKSLKEVVDQIGLTRRQIQEYEKKGIAFKPQRPIRELQEYGINIIKNTTLPLEYTDKEIERLLQIRYYKELGYTAEQMKKIFEDPAFDRRTSLTEQINALMDKRQKIDNLIKMSQDLILNEPDSDTLLHIKKNIDSPFDLQKEIINHFPKSKEEWDMVIRKYFSSLGDEKKKIYDQSRETIMSYCTEDTVWSRTKEDLKLFTTNEIQAEVQNIFDIVKDSLPGLGDTLVEGIFGHFVEFFRHSDSYEYNKLEEKYGTQKLKFYYNSLYLFLKHKMKEIDVNCSEALNDILKDLLPAINLGVLGYEPDSEEVQKAMSVFLNNSSINKEQIFLYMKIIEENMDKITLSQNEQINQYEIQQMTFVMNALQVALQSNNNKK